MTVEDLNVVFAVCVSVSVWSTASTTAGLWCCAATSSHVYPLQEVGADSQSHNAFQVCVCSVLWV